MPPEREVQRTLCRCAKARGAVDMVYHPDRILTPLKRTAGGFEEIPLDQALDEIAAHVVDVTERYDARAVGVWKGEAVGFGQQESFARRFAHALGTPNYLSNDSMCYVARFLHPRRSLRSRQRLPPDEVGGSAGGAGMSRRSCTTRP